ncbi:MAG: hypothetical protein LBN93_06155 [Candidatus Symbiothrix sp.]|jgi:hypothetical protein|nr:hypothetical protein [Candidatus Symbiothrix sp.]
MPRSQDIKDFIREHQALFWYSPEDKCETVSDELLVETILNYGDMSAVVKLFRLMGIKKVAKIYFSSINRSERSKNNYHELTSNYFTLLFNRYAH